MRKQIVTALAVLVLSGQMLSSQAGLAATSDIASHRRADFYAPGKHQFYAWCADGQDRLVAEKGASANDAEAKLLASQKVAGSCRLSWQGRIPSSLIQRDRLIQPDRRMTRRS